MIDLVKFEFHYLFVNVVEWAIIFNWRIDILAGKVDYLAIDFLCLHYVYLDGIAPYSTVSVLGKGEPPKNNEWRFVFDNLISQRRIPMKKYLGPLVVALVVALIPATQASVGMGFVDLPQNVETGITAVITFGVAWIFTKLILLVPFLAFLKQFETPLALAISAQFIAFVEKMVPDAYGGVAITGIVFLLAILALFGVGAKVWGKKEAQLQLP